MSAQDDRSRARLGMAITKPINTRSVKGEKGRRKKLMYVAQKRTGSTINIVDAITHTRAVSSFGMRG